MTGRTVPRLMLVDDNGDSVEALSLILAEKYDVSGYTSPRDALAALAAVKPDVVVLDIGMRPIDGMQCLKTMRAMPECGHVPALALTGFARDVDRRTFLAAGFQAVVVKPILDLEALVATIDALLEPAGRAAEPPATDRRQNGLSSAARHLDCRPP